MYVGSGENYSLRERSYTVPVANFDALMMDLDLFFSRFAQVMPSNLVFVPLRGDDEYTRVVMLPNDPVASPLNSPQRQDEILDMLHDQKIIVCCGVCYDGRPRIANIASIYEDDGAIAVQFNACEGLPVDPADLDGIVSSYCADSAGAGDRFLNTPLEDGGSWCSSAPYRGAHRRARNEKHSRVRSTRR